jgi:tRNA-dihydrouridine synthase
MVGNFILAPLAELTHRPLRELVESFKTNDDEGADEYFSEMISAGALVYGGPFEQWYIDAEPCPQKLVYQVVGGKTCTLVKAIELLDKRECLGIDINMGCSAPAITRTGAGVRWMENIDKAALLIARARASTRRRLSVKLGTGITDDFEYLVRFCRRLEEEGLDLITLHPRTAKQKFKRKARWSYVSALRKELKIPVAGNGDVTSGEEALHRLKECDAVMLGRLAIRRPWIFKEIKHLRAGEVHRGEILRRDALRFNIEETGIRFLQFLSRYQPPEFHISRAHRFFGYFCDNLKWGNHLKNLINRENELSGIERVWIRYFVENEE